MQLLGEMRHLALHQAGVSECQSHCLSPILRERNNLPYDALIMRGKGLVEVELLEMWPTGTFSNLTSYMADKRHMRRSTI